MPSESVAYGQMRIDRRWASNRCEVPENSTHVYREVHAMTVLQLEAHAYTRHDIPGLGPVSVYDVAALAQKEELRPRPVHEIVLGLQPHGECRYGKPGELKVKADRGPEEQIRPVEPHAVRGH